MIEIMDTTLRDGEQTSGVSFATPEKMSIARLLLEELHVDRIEIASARVSEGEYASVKKVAKWAKDHGQIESNLGHQGKYLACQHPYSLCEKFYMKTLPLRFYFTSILKTLRPQRTLYFVNH